jgi:hypothetical protein
MKTLILCRSTGTLFEVLVSLVDSSYGSSNPSTPHQDTLFFVVFRRFNCISRTTSNFHAVIRSFWSPRHWHQFPLPIIPIESIFTKIWTVLSEITVFLISHSIFTHFASFKVCFHRVDVPQWRMSLVWRFVSAFSVNTPFSHRNICIVQNGLEFNIPGYLDPV